MTLNEAIVAIQNDRPLTVNQAKELLEFAIAEGAAIKRWQKRATDYREYLTEIATTDKGNAGILALEAIGKEA